MSVNKNNNTPEESQDGMRAVDTSSGPAGHLPLKGKALRLEITGKYNTARRAVHIAAVIMERDGLCRYESHRECRRVWPPSRETCVKCIENWLISKARKELQDA